MTKIKEIKNDAITSMANLNSENIIRIRDYFLNLYKPKDVSEAIKMINFLYIVSKASSSIKQACTEVLNRRRNVDGEMVDSVSGLKVLRKDKPKIKIYNPTEELKLLYMELDILNSKIEQAKQKAGYIEQQEEGYNYSVKL